MVNSYVPLRFTIFISFSIAAASSFKLASSQSPSSFPKATAGDLLSVLGPSSAASYLNPAVSREIKSCLKFLVPFKSDKSKPELGRCSLRTGLCSGKIDAVEKLSKFEEENSLIWWPPESVLELARLAVDSGGDPGSIQRTLNPKMIPVCLQFDGLIWLLFVRLNWLNLVYRFLMLNDQEEIDVNLQELLMVVIL